MSTAKMEIVIFAGYVGEFIGTILPSIYYKMPFGESLTLTLIMCCKGVIELSIYMIITRQTYTLLIIIMIIITGLALIFIRHLYDTSTRRTISNSDQNFGLRILVCIHSEENVSSLTNLLVLSNPTKESPIFVSVVQLMEITGQAASILVKHDRQNNSLISNLYCSGHIGNAFDHYESYSEGSVMIQNFKAIAQCASMHDDICTLAVDQKTSIIIAPCSIGALVDRSQIGGNPSVLNDNSSYRIAMLFLGGRADDREALVYSIRMAGHPNVSLTVCGVTTYKTNSYQGNLDKEVLNEFWASIAGKRKIYYKKETVRQGVDTRHVIHKMADNFDLVIVGKYHEPDSPVTLGLKEGSESPSFGGAAAA
ncbi:cation/h(+) antiporter 14 [Quercus suber]|uniref:Cation/h(+) antiporter 14 n=1 Tax=Quercus suber TaxID=58331 RepID=A0AAW0JY74_QUESU